MSIRLWLFITCIESNNVTSFLSSPNQFIIDNNRYQFGFIEQTQMRTKESKRLRQLQFLLVSTQQNFYGKLSPPITYVRK